MAERVVEVSCEIDAPIEVVWKILTDVEAYASWNPFVVKVDAPLGGTRPGSLMRFDVRWAEGGSARSKEIVVIAEGPAQADDGTWAARWVYDYKGLSAALGMIRARRTQELRQVPGRATRYSSHEVFSGWGSSLVPFERVEAGFRAQAEALKLKAEAG